MLMQSLHSSQIIESNLLIAYMNNLTIKTNL